MQREHQHQWIKNEHILNQMKKMFSMMVWQRSFEALAIGLGAANALDFNIFL